MYVYIVLIYAYVCVRMYEHLKLLYVTLNQLFKKMIKSFICKLDDIVGCLELLLLAVCIVGCYVRKGEAGEVWHGWYHYKCKARNGK